MTDLPINVSSAPANASAGKQPVNVNATQQEGQDFGNMLSRKVAGSAKADESPPRSGAEGSKQALEQENTDNANIEDAGNKLPGDMLSALLAQQNQPAMIQPDGSSQSDTGAVPGDNTQPAAIYVQPDPNLQTALTPQASASAMRRPSTDVGAALTLIGSKGNQANSSQAALDTAIPRFNNQVQPGIGFVETATAPGMKEVSSSTSNQPAHVSVAGELPVSAQQTAIFSQQPGTSAPASPTSISTPLTQAAWGDEFSQKITWMATQRNQSAELHLNPPQLGPLDVVLKMNGDQATALFTSPHAAVREAIEQALPKLREMLADSGIMLGNAMVSDQTAKNNQDNPSPKAAGRMSTSASDDTAESTGIQEVRVSSRSRHNGMVDTFA